MKRVGHIIQKQSIEIGFSGMDDALGIQDRIAEVFYSRLQPQMNVLFDEIADERYLLSLHRLEIDCGILSHKNWEDEWVQNTLQQLKKELLTMHRKRINENSESAEESLLFFLEHGHLPWNKNFSAIKDAEERIQISPAFIFKLKEALAVNEVAVKRFINNSSEEFINKVIEVVFRLNSHFAVLLKAQTFRLLNNRLWEQTILEMFSLNKQSENITGLFLQHLYKNADEDTRTKIEMLVNAEFEHGQDILPVVRKGLLQTKNEIVKKPGEDRAIYLANAGLVLLHPFLPQLFELTGLTNGNKWLYERAADNAVKILHYLVSGDTEYAEFNYPLNKILCGMQPGDLVNDSEELNDETRKACETLLQEVINYWGKLRNTSIEALRENFLKRDGKLSVTDNGWLLQPEKKSIDVLLNYLPWGLGIVKLPWMNDILYTEW